MNFWDYFFGVVNKKKGALVQYVIYASMSISIVVFLVPQYLSKGDILTISIVLFFIALSVTASAAIFVQKSLLKGDTDHEIMSLVNSKAKHCCAEKMQELNLCESDILKVFGLVDFEGIKQIEGEIAQGEIWILTYDLEAEIAEEGMACTVEANLGKGLKYVYFTLPNEENSVNIELLKQKHSGYTNQMVFYPLPEDDSAFGVSTYDVIIYNPLTTSTNGRKGYISVGTTGHYSQWLYKEIPHADLKTIMGRLMSIKKGGPISV